MLNVRQDCMAPIELQPVFSTGISGASIICAPIFLSLMQGASRQLLTGDASRESEIVFDLRARSGLASRGFSFDEERIDPFRGGIDRRTEPRWACTDDHQITHMGVVHV